MFNEDLKRLYEYKKADEIMRKRINEFAHRLIHFDDRYESLVRSYNNLLYRYRIIIILFLCFIAYHFLGGK